MDKVLRNASAGRPTVGDSSLRDHRDRIVDMLACWWGEVGWQLPRASSRQELRSALDPLTEHANRFEINHFLLLSTDSATAEQIREKRELNKKAIQELYKAQKRQLTCSDRFNQAQMALGHTSSEQLEAMKRRISDYKAELDSANNGYEAAQTKQREIARKLDEMEAAYAQDELLMFIQTRFIKPKKRYARNPENLANAMAGLPWAGNLPFMGTWQSYVRCSKLRCSPHHRFQLFETIQRIWKKSQKSKLPTTEFFHQQITALPKIVTLKAINPLTNQESRNKGPNSVRSNLFDNWPIWKLAIQKSLESPVEPDRVPFLICSNFTVVQRDPRASVALVLGAE